VPLFENNNECTRALEHRQSIINDYKSWNPKSVIIASHMNPHPTVMGNRQIDHNIGLIIPLTDEVCEITGKETRIFCGHLHKSAKPYEWNLASKKGAIIYPLDVDELYIINTNKTFEEPILKKIN
jgi:hypothetical protein